MDKWTRKYLKLARTLADDNDACHSRKIGVVLVGKNNRIISMGYNGSVAKAPHNDRAEYLTYLWDHMLNEQDRFVLAGQHNVTTLQQFVSTFAGKKFCPRRILGIASGYRLDLCNCAHAERNALASAGRNGVSTEGSVMYCYCGVPCHECCIQLIQSGITKVVCLKVPGPDYSPSSRHLFRMSGVELVEVDPVGIDLPERREA